MIVMKRKAIHMLENWQPTELKGIPLKSEAVAVVEELQHIDSPTDLGKTIQGIYEQSISIWIPFEKCVEISYKLLAIKFEAKSIL
ncbi:DUF1871 family protein [Kurthia sibirica]|nr:DUF1871 family protein [Kurthia sibirica]